MPLRPTLGKLTDTELDDLFPGFRDIAKGALAIGACLYAAFAWCYLVFEPQHLREPLFAFAALTALLFSGFYDVLQTPQLRRHVPSWTMFAVVLGAWFNASLHLWLVGNPAPLAGIRIVIIIAGIVLWRRSTLLIIILLSIASTAIMMVFREPTAAWVYYGADLGEAIVVAVATFVGKRTVLLRNFELRGEERRARLEAEENLRQARETQRELAASRDAAQSGNLSKSRFLATMSHELRTPLNAILGFSEMIAKETFGPAPPRYVEYANIVHESGAHLLSLIDEVLDLSKIEAGKLELRLERHDVAKLAEEAVKLAGAKFKRECPPPEILIAPGLPPLLADRRAAIQMIVNLLSNAMKFTPRQGRIAISANADEHGGIAICVSDTGTGIAAADLPNVTAPFAQVADSWTKHHGGAGLGLSIVKSLIEQHGGRLVLESEPGKGTRATLTFPPEYKASHAA